MPRSRNKLNRLVFLAFGLAVGGACNLAWAGAVLTRTLVQTVPLPSGARIKVENLAGRMTVTQGTGPLVITATIFAGGELAPTLVRAITLTVHTAGSEVTVDVKYPVDEYRDYLYAPPHTRGAPTDSRCFLGVICGVNHSRINYQGARVSVNTRGGHGVALYANVNIKLPAGVTARLVNHVGTLVAHNLHNALAVRTDNGDLWVQNLTGNLSVDAGSGDLHTARLTGNLKAETGSGDVMVDEVNGDVYADTGSGDIRISNAMGDTLSADTGSGDVTLTNVRGNMTLDTGSGDCLLDRANGSLHADTGSGDVVGRNYVSRDRIWADTGSGDVRLSGDLSATRRLYVDTGSGTISLKTTHSLSMRLIAASDSGEVSIKLPDMNHVVVKSGYFSGDIGKGQGKGTISSGSGNISLSGN